MIIGIDFDNTLVDYTGVFHRVAVDLGWIPASVRPDKTSVRDYLRGKGGEELWIELQGLVYGPHIFSAQPFPGATDFLRYCRQKGMDFFIISHKTRFPFLGKKHDLHDYALQWLGRNGIGADRAYFELTKEDKLSRIAGLKSDYFVDDLPEFLTEPRFPAQVQRILFDPHQNHESNPLYQRVASWEECWRLVA
ncbi:MAG: haloacid dehalogenase-like hydrolase [Deltaproteobacteria bacterium]|nr:haloacid dehalogenase-like hydrolase [Deltaproteobacteria bacterium]MBI4223965.1 haloacid dehalogenase-like hydrolase [Deltaproteobacteria bacterium]